MLPVCLGLVFLLDVPTQFDWFSQHIGSFLILSVLMPILEEIVFRGLIQEKLAQITGHASLARISAANLITSLLFVIFHLINHPPVWALLVLFPSLVFGYSKDKYKCLAAPILLHITYNAVYYVTFGMA